MSDLKNKLIKLAYDNPKLRGHLLPLLAGSRSKSGSNPHAGRTVTVYVDKMAKGLQPPGVILDPKVAQILKSTKVGDLTLPRSSGLMQTPLKDLEGVPVATLVSKPEIEKAYRAGAELPPIEIQVTGDKVQLLDGHHRLNAARRAKIPTIPVKWYLR